MKIIATSTEQFGPFTTVSVLEDRYKCDNLELQFSVIGPATVVDYVAPDVSVRPPEEVKDEVVQLTQIRLDSFAQDRGYDSILSACSYVSSSVVKFATEGQYCVSARDATWAKLLEILDEVVAGTRPMPSGYAEIEPELPPLVWPN